MSLSSSISLAANTLQATQIGLQVVGQNIANANTPGYIREEVVLSPADTQQKGGLLLGLGVKVHAVVQKIDLYLEERLRSSISDRAGAEAKEQAFLRLEGVLGELSDTDLSTSLNDFFNSISEILNQPESASVRNLAVLQGQTLSTDIHSLVTRVRDIYSDVNGRIENIGGEINTLTEQIAGLNIRITAAERGGASNSDAVGLRDQRLQALTRLAELVDVRVTEQPSGSVSVYAGGDYLVLQGTRREVFVDKQIVDGLPRSEVRIAQIDAPLSLAGGELGGLSVARDDVLKGYLDDLDDFAGTLAFEFNKIYSSGQGLHGYDRVESERPVDATNVALDAAGLKFSPVNGSFDVLVLNQNTQLTNTTTIRVDLNGLGDDTTLADIAAQLDAVDGISASVDLSGYLGIESDSSSGEFSFADDTSGLLAALGINTFFSGTTAADIGVQQAVVDDPAKFAASGGGIGADTEIAVHLAQFIDQPLDTKNDASLTELYDRLTSKVAQGSTVARSLAEGFRVFEAQLTGEKLAISGVSIDEEAVNMLALQHAYQASARYIAILSELLDILVSL